MCWQAAQWREDTRKTMCSLWRTGMGFGSIIMQRAVKVVLKVAVIEPP